VTGLDISMGRIYISCDVIFDESVFPFTSLHPTAGAVISLRFSYHHRNLGLMFLLIRLMFLLCLFCMFLILVSRFSSIPVLLQVLVRKLILLHLRDSWFLDNLPRIQLLGPSTTTQVPIDVPTAPAAPLAPLSCADMDPGRSATVPAPGPAATASASTSMPGCAGVSAPVCEPGSSTPSALHLGGAPGLWMESPSLKSIKDGIVRYANLTSSTEPYNVQEALSNPQ
jgi:hypothetical protein